MNVWKNLARYFGGAVIAFITFFEVPVYHDHSTYLEVRGALAAAGCSTCIITVNSVADLGLGNWGEFPNINILSYVAGLNKGGGIFYRKTTGGPFTSDHCGLLTDNVNNGFQRIDLDRPMTVERCGATGNGTTDDSAAEQYGINWILNGGIKNTVQSAPAGELDWGVGTFITNTTLTFGNSSPNAGIWLKGSGWGGTVLYGQALATGTCVINDQLQAAASKISDMYLVTATGNCGVTLAGNGITLENLWLNAVYGIISTGSTDVKITNIVCDQCYSGTILFQTGISKTFNISGVETFGTSATPFQEGIICGTASSGIVVTNFTTFSTPQSSIDLSAGCEMTVTGYSFEANGNVGIGQGAQIGISVTGSGSELHISAGKVAGYGANGLYVGPSAFVYSAGNSFVSNVELGGLSTPYDVYVHEGSLYQTGGVLGGGSGNERGLAVVDGNGNGVLSLNGVQLGGSSTYGVLSTNTYGTVASVMVVGGQISGTNTIGGTGFSPIALGPVTAAIICNEQLSSANVTTTPVSYTSGTVTLCTNQAHNAGTWLTSTGALTSVNNTTY